MADCKNELESILDELDSYSVNPSEQDYMDKVIFADIYRSLDHVALTKFSNLSGRVVHLDTDINSLNRDVVKMGKVGNHYINAIQDLGAFIAKSISQNVDYVVMSKDPEVMVEESLLANYVWRLGPQAGDYCKWINTFSSNKNDYRKEIQDYYTKIYAEKLELIREASKRRIAKKKNPLPPIHVIWEDQFYDFLLNRHAFDKSLLKWKMKLELIRGGDFDRMIPFIEDGKSVELSIKLKKGAQEEIDKAIEYMNSCRAELGSIATLEKEPKVVGQNVIMVIRSRKQDDESLTNKFVNESDNEKLKRAVEMFAEYVEKVEERMDQTNDYNQPTIANAVFKGKRVVGSEKYNKIKEFLDSIKDLMAVHDMNYDIDSTPDEIVEAISKYFYDIVSRDNQGVDLDGLSGVRVPIGIAVAYMNYVSPISEIEFEFAHDKWELRGDYSSGKVVCLSMNRYDEIGKVGFRNKEKRDM